MKNQSNPTFFHAPSLYGYLIIAISLISACSQDNDKIASGIFTDIANNNVVIEGRDFGKGHFSPLDEINQNNIKDLGWRAYAAQPNNENFEMAPDNATGH
jgi:glucose dehydrogenase